MVLAIYLIEIVNIIRIYKQVRMIFAGEAVKSGNPKI